MPWPAGGLASQRRLRGLPAGARAPYPMPMRSAPLLLILLLGVLALAVGLGRWLALARRRRLRRALYQGQLEQAVADGVLTPEEVAQLEKLRQEGALSDGEVRMAALAVYRRALGAAMADSRITEDEEATLRHMQELLGLSDRDLAGDAAHLRRMHLLAHLEHGRLPEVDAPVDLPADEAAHWMVQATLCERIAYSNRPFNDPRALLFNVDSAEPFSAAGEREMLGTSTSLMPMDLGVLVVTGRALRFRGARSDLIIPHTRLRRLALFRDGFRLDLADPIASRYFLVADPELTAAVLLLAARRLTGGTAAMTPRAGD